MDRKTRTLPEGWSLCRLGDIAKIASGGTPDRTVPAYWGGDIPWVTTSEIKFNVIRSVEELITPEGLRNSAAKLFPPGTLLIAMYGQGKTRGQVAKLAIEASTNQACSAIILNPGQDPDFFFQVLSSRYESIRELGNAGTQKNLNGGIVKKIEVPVPRFVEQRSIARVLACWDEAIIVAERILRNSHTLKLALMHRLLLPSKSRGWRTYRLKDLFAERNESDRGDLPLLSITRDEGVILREDVGRKNTSNDDKSKYLRICKGDIGYNTMRMWQGVSALSSLEGIISPAYTVVVPNERIDARFAAYLFKLDRVVSKFYRHSQGLVSDTWNLKFKHFSRIAISIPTREEQDNVVNILATADRTIEALAKKLKQMRQEKSALMQQLLTGKRRVKLDPAA